MWDDGVDMPLWDEEGPLPNDPDWLWRELGLTPELVADLAAWAMVSPRHDVQAQRLFERLRAEIHEGLEVVDRQEPRDTIQA